MERLIRSQSQRLTAKAVVEVVVEEAEAVAEVEAEAVEVELLVLHNLRVVVGRLLLLARVGGLHHRRLQEVAVRLALHEQEEAGTPLCLSSGRADRATNRAST
jgi:hypothetical protein